MKKIKNKYLLDYVNVIKLKGILYYYKKIILLYKFITGNNQINKINI